MNDANGSEMTDAYGCYPQKQVKFPLLSPRFWHCAEKVILIKSYFQFTSVFSPRNNFLLVSKITLFPKLPNIKIENLVHLVCISAAFGFVCLMTDLSFLVFLCNCNLCRCTGSSIEDCIGLMDRYLVCLLPMFFLQGSMREHWCMCVHATVDGQWWSLFCNCLQV